MKLPNSRLLRSLTLCLYGQSRSQHHHHPVSPRVVRAEARFNVDGVQRYGVVLAGLCYPSHEPIVHRLVHIHADEHLDSDATARMHVYHRREDALQRQRGVLL
jgi:hypothetical protein